MTTGTTPRQLVAVIEGDTTIQIGDDARTALRREQIGALAAAQLEVEAAFLAIGQLDEPSARGELETLAEALRKATAAADALWWLAPADEDEEV